MLDHEVTDPAVERIALELRRPVDLGHQVDAAVMSAIRAAPDADVVFVAHAVLEDVGTFRELWGRIPLTRPIPSRYWRIPPSEVPKEEAELIDWLYAWWERIDAWIDEHSAPLAVEPEVL